MPSKIEHIDESWNPIQDTRKGPQGNGYHCTKLSAGCRNCWAEEINRRFGNGHPFDDSPAEFELIDKTLKKPLHWKKPRRIGVQFMGDLFHEYIPFDLIDQAFYVMQEEADHHNYFILTKRPDRLLEYYEYADYESQGAGDPEYGIKAAETGNFEITPNIWIGITAENQQRFDERWPILAQIPAEVRFVSLEPLLGPIDLVRSAPGIDWVIAGGESGPHARPMHPQWVRQIRDDCQTYGIPFFFKQWGDYIPSYDAGFRSDEVDRWRREFGQAWLKSKRKWRFKDGTQMVHVGKKAAGRHLDGRTWDQLPERIKQ